MKKLTLYLSIIIFMSCIGNAKQNVLDIQKKKNDSIQEQYVNDSIKDASINKYVVKKISGKDVYNGKTLIEYTSLNSLIDEANKKSKIEMWKNDYKDSYIKYLKENSAGGDVTLEIKRNTIGSADMQFYSIIIQDTSGNEVFRKDLEHSTAETPGADDLWWNLSSVGIPKRIDKPFYVYVVDKIHESNFKFEVIAVKK